MEIAIIRTATPIAIPPIVITEIKERNFDPWFVLIYLLAIENENFI
jgi:hypothetical protein